MFVLTSFFSVHNTERELHVKQEGEEKVFLISFFLYRTSRRGGGEQRGIYSTR